MKKLKYAVIFLALAACGTPENKESSEVEKTPQEKALLLRDSAMVLSKNGDVDGSIALLDQAIALDPKSKGMILAKLNTLYQNGDHEGVLEVLEVIDGSSIRDPYSTLHLGMEYELAGKKELAEIKYNYAVNSFLGVLDTMPVTKQLKRNTCLMNLALAVSLSDSKENKEKLENVMSDAEKKDLEVSLNALSSTSRDKLLQVRRKNKS